MSKKSRKILGAAVAFFAVAAFAPVFGLEVDRKELESVGSGGGVVFQNYSGPHTVINSVDQIRGIGSALAPSISANPDRYASVGNSARYQIIHAVDEKEQGKLDADILVIGSNATVDHITNLRRIISAYLSSAYDYSRRDADTIAVFATVYNAVYRGNMDNFSEKYKKVVVDSLNEARVGLSKNYQEWPGATQIVIPLYDVRGGLSTVDSSEIAGRQVIESLQGEDDKGIDARKGMVDIMDREADAASDAADEARKRAEAEAEKAREEAEKASEANREAAEAKREAASAQKDADGAQKQADSAQKNADAAQAAADEAKRHADAAQAAADEAQREADAAKAAAEAAQRTAEENPNDAVAQADAAQKQAEADAAQKQADAAQKQADAEQKNADQKQGSADAAQQNAEQKQAQADAAQQNAEQKQAQAEAKQGEAEQQAQRAGEQAQRAGEQQAQADEQAEAAERKRAEAQAERDSIARDQEEVMNRESVADENVLYGLKSVDEIGTMSAIVKMNSQNGELVKESPVSVIRSRTVYEDGSNFVAIAGTNFGNGAIKLVLIDKDSLEIVGESNEILSETSVLVEFGGSYFCVVKTGTASFVVGKFNNNAQLLIQSDVPVKAATPITITKKGVLVTSSDGVPVLLNESDLTAITKNVPTASANVDAK